MIAMEKEDGMQSMEWPVHITVYCTCVCVGNFIEKQQQWGYWESVLKNPLLLVVGFKSTNDMGYVVIFEW